MKLIDKIVNSFELSNAEKVELSIRLLDDVAIDTDNGNIDKIVKKLQELRYK